VSQWASVGEPRQRSGAGYGDGAGQKKIQAVRFLLWGRGKELPRTGAYLDKLRLASHRESRASVRYVTWACDTSERGLPRLECRNGHAYRQRGESRVV
jgi:hypothetical protein